MKLLALLLLAQCVAWGQLPEIMRDNFVDEFDTSSHGGDSLVTKFKTKSTPARSESLKLPTWYDKGFIGKYQEMNKHQRISEPSESPYYCPSDCLDSLIVWWGEYQTQDSLFYAELDSISKRTQTIQYLSRPDLNFPDFMDWLKRRKK